MGVNDYDIMNLKIDLTKKESNGEIKELFAEYSTKIAGFSTTNGTYKAGDVVVILSGYNSDIEYTIEILGFDSEGMAYMVWDCYWFPIDLSKRLVDKEAEHAV